jgi:hypothetical protein
VDQKRREYIPEALVYSPGNLAVIIGVVIALIFSLYNFENIGTTGIVVDPTNGIQMAVSFVIGRYAHSCGWVYGHARGSGS